MMLRGYLLTNAIPSLKSFQQHRQDSSILQITMSAIQTSTPTATSGNLGADLKPAGQAQQKVKPCCVCTTEKAARDECMLFSTAKEPQEHCKDLVTKYKSCMAGYGFTL